MPKISTYQTVTPQGDDTIIISQANGSPTDATKNITVNSLTSLVQEEAGMLYVDTEISSAELLSINSNGIELVPQPTNGDIVFIKNILAKYTFGTTPYTKNGNTNFSLPAFYFIDNVYSSVSGSQNISLTWDESRNTISAIFGNAQIPTVPSSIKLTGSNVIGGDGTLKVRTYYGVIPSTF
jgi:hypothetical protein